MKYMMQDEDPEQLILPLGDPPVEDVTGDDVVEDDDDVITDDDDDKDEDVDDDAIDEENEVVDEEVK